MHEQGARDLLMKARQERQTALLALRQAIITKGAAEDERKIRRELDLLDSRISQLLSILEGGE